MTLPTLWEDAGHPKWDGLAWFRRTFDLPASWKGGDIELRLSAIDDADTTWVNGQVVGAISGWNTPRAYRVPGSLLKPSGNTIAVRVLDTGGGGGIWNAKTPFEIAALDGSFSPISLAGPWRSHFAAPIDEHHRPPADPNESAGNPTVLYNAMIAPLIPYGIRGVAFYQGEANAERAQQYQTLFPALIADWRRRWKEGDFPFLFVQIAPFNGQPPEIREAQLLAMQATKNTAMVVTIDVGDADDIHPANKKPVGERLALAARALAYGENVEYSGPLFSRASFKQGRATVSFTHVGGGLVAHEGDLKGFSIAGADGAFQPATATIEGDTLVVRAEAVTEPKAARYAWANVASGNLFNRAGLPASPFRSDREAQ
jgi:sialate O-acetylesterase